MCLGHTGDTGHTGHTGHTGDTGDTRVVSKYFYPGNSVSQAPEFFVLFCFVFLNRSHYIIAGLELAV